MCELSNRILQPTLGKRPLGSLLGFSFSLLVSLDVNLGTMAKPDAQIALPHLI